MILRFFCACRKGPAIPAQPQSLALTLAGPLAHLFRLLVRCALLGLELAALVVIHELRTACVLVFIGAAYLLGRLSLTLNRFAKWLEKELAPLPPSIRFCTRLGLSVVSDPSLHRRCYYAVFTVP